ncbi:hypothetical protein ZIOFF_028399 [Zingiber officinale]|uniref:TF-B3 domain-containing protein n=1 Tax=Zingiber officinale TaxID=94328 RepID=A0A8J5L8Y7_ZINOF|nr:hypothetical protein ZIOFF_028399 [Zingiber officinale]
MTQNPDHPLLSYQIKPTYKELLTGSVRARLGEGEIAGRAAPVRRKEEIDGCGLAVSGEEVARGKGSRGCDARAVKAREEGVRRWAKSKEEGGARKCRRCSGVDEGGDAGGVRGCSCEGVRRRKVRAQRWFDAKGESGEEGVGVGFRARGHGMASPPTCSCCIPKSNENISKKVECGSSAQYVRRPFTRLQQCAIAQDAQNIISMKHYDDYPMNRIQLKLDVLYYTFCGLRNVSPVGRPKPSPVVIPKGFYNHLRDILITAIFSCEGKTWEVMYFGDRVSKYFGSGLNNFIFDNDIREGDGVVFELIHKKNLHFRVQILHVDVHFHAKDGDDGGSTDNPILID